LLPYIFICRRHAICEKTRDKATPTMLPSPHRQWAVVENADRHCLKWAVKQLKELSDRFLP
jgi:hypothetical protein